MPAALDNGQRSPRMLILVTMVHRRCSHGLRRVVITRAGDGERDRHRRPRPRANTVKLDASANAVRPVEQPFQQLIIDSTQDGLEQCRSITPPSGMSLTIDSFSAEVFAARKPQAYIRSVRIGDSGSFLFVRGLALDLRPLPRDRWAGDVQTRLTTGHAPDPHGGTWLYTVCVSGEDADGFFFASIQAVVSGTLTPEQ